MSKKIKFRDSELGNNWGTTCTLVQIIAKQARLEIEKQTGETIVSFGNAQMLGAFKQ